MPRIRTQRSKKPPDGFKEIEETLTDFETRLKDIENDDDKANNSKSSSSTLWPIYKINHQRSRYIYNLYYEKEAISKDLYQWLLKNHYGDANLIAKWKKSGYEKLCCLQCIQTSSTNFNSTCICRVPIEKRNNDSNIECVTCGCHGCASCD